MKIVQAKGEFFAYVLRCVSSLLLVRMPFAVTRPPSRVRINERPEVPLSEVQLTLDTLWTVVAAEVNGSIRSLAKEGGVGGREWSWKQISVTFLNSHLNK